MYKHKPIIDVCCGSRMFWFDKHNAKVLFADNRSLETTFNDRGRKRKLEVKPDVLHDFTDMPYPDNSFKLVIFDPPHLIHGGDKSWLVKKYGRLNKDWRTQLKRGFHEFMRILDINGTLIFKWNETQISAKEIINIFGVTPAIGHRSGKAQKTHWMVFFKGK